MKQKPGYIRERGNAMAERADSVGLPPVYGVTYREMLTYIATIEADNADLRRQVADLETLLRREEARG